ncbi:uncharacterized protein LOC114352281 [Ostrinia furnacalis]|uniref:uncharacterized protein LOC114352281 n=1 Tax=Ostrinia furnacalis TaxID=93504 RepID=UPI00103BB936|nr:uncharacterized protein LOC114352281 [Ostrinia furnacalis]
MKLFRFIQRLVPLSYQVRFYKCKPQSSKPRHLICFKQWTATMVMDIITSALNLKCRHVDTHGKRLDVLTNCKVMILQEVNEPILNMAVSKAATFLGAYDVNIIDHLVWDKDYFGKVFSMMTDVIFVATATHMCVQRFADQATVPVLCMRSRTHASIQALATVMAIIEEFGTMKSLNVAYIGAPHPVLNSYLLLCPMLGANIRYKCCCKETGGICPLLHKASEDLTAQTRTECRECESSQQVLCNTSVIISGPTSCKKEAAKGYKINLGDIEKSTPCEWIFFHTCPRGDECDDDLFNHCNSRTFKSFQNMHYITAALMANAVKGLKF